MALCLGALGLSTALTSSSESMLEPSGRTSGQLAMHEAVMSPESLATTTAHPHPATARSRPAKARNQQQPLEDAEPDQTMDDATAIAEPEPPTKSRTRSRNRASSRTTKPKASPKTTTTTKTDGSIPVECVLDPSRCDGRGHAAKTPAADSGSRPKPLPSKLSTSQLKQALATTKADARRCGPEHGVDRGITVRVKLSIEGSTGSVLSATPRDEHASGSLGRCVARALAQTEFPRFSSTRMGTIYSIRL